jgi:hypothetical protein
VVEKAASERVSDHSISGYSISSVILIIVYVYIGLSPWSERQQEDNRLGLPLVCLPLWLGGCDPYIPSCLYVTFMQSMLHIGLDR